jgi:cytochrome oxidase assembly protein ShyY1
VLRNRKYSRVMGVHVITPLQLDHSQSYVLVDRGFIPLSKSDSKQRTSFQKKARVDFVGLVKETVSRRFLAPHDPPAGQGFSWVDAWLRVDIESMQKQLPYALLPVFLEIMETQDAKAVEQKIVDSSASGREEMFFLGSSENQVADLGHEDVGNGDYPIPVFDTVTPPDIHLGYVFEWAAMALLTVLICLVLQLRRPKAHSLMQSTQAPIS